MKKLFAILLILRLLMATASAATVQIDMPEPDSFPEEVYLLDLVKLQDLSILCDESRFLNLFGLDNLPPTMWLSADSDFLAWQPYAPLNLEYAPYPIIGWLPGDALLTDAENGMWGQPWTRCQVSAELVNTQVELARQLLLRIGYPCDEPATLYRSVLSDGRATTEMGFPLMVEGLPLHSSFFLAPGAYETNSGDWGYVTGDSAHLILLDNLEIYSLYMPEYLTVEGRQRVSIAIADHRQALRFLEESIFNSYDADKTIIVTSMRPCYLKHPVEGTNVRYTGRPSWEVTYYIPDDDGRFFFRTNYVDALDGAVY